MTKQPSPDYSSASPANTRTRTDPDRGCSPVTCEAQPVLRLEQPELNSVASVRVNARRPSAVRRYRACTRMSEVTKRGIMRCTHLLAI